MTLSLGVIKGSRIQVGDSTVVEVVDTLRGKAIQIKVGPKTYVVTDRERIEIAEEVFVSFGAPVGASSRFRGLRLAFEASRDKRITRLENAAPI